jgi:hypothetical protein
MVEFNVELVTGVCLIKSIIFNSFGMHMLYILILYTMVVVAWNRSEKPQIPKILVKSLVLVIKKILIKNFYKCALFDDNNDQENTKHIRQDFLMNVITNYYVSI